MGKYRSLGDFLIVNEYRFIISEILNYIRKNSIYTSSEVFKNPQKYDLRIDMDISLVKEQHFKASSFNLDFDIVVRAITSITELVGDELYTNSFNDKFTLTLSGYLFNGLHNLKCHKVELGDCARPYSVEKSLSKFLVPYVHDYQYEKYATEFLKEFLPTAIKNPITVIVPLIIRRMELNLIKGVLPDDAFGKMIFNYEQVINVHENGKKVKSLAKPGTVMIDYKIFDLHYIGRLNNTIMHECVHWWIHRKYFELQKLLDSGETSLICENEENEMPSESEFKNKYYMELQARQIAPRILMPELAAKKKFKTIMNKLKTGKYTSRKEYISHCVDEFADFFSVSLESAKIRLCDLGFSEVLSILKTVNGKEIIPFKYSIKLKPRQTFIIDSLQAAQIIMKNTKIRELVREGKFIYIDGFFVLNDAKYVKIYKNSKPKLTTIALNDVSKCCLLFDIVNESVSINYNPSVYNYMNFYSGGAITTYKKKYTVKESKDVNKNVFELASGKRLREDNDEAIALINEMRKLRSFGEKFTYLLSDNENCLCYKYDTTVAKKCHTTDKTIKSYKDGKTKPNLKQMIAICGGLKLHPRLSNYLLKSLTYDINDNEEDPYPLYVELINTKYPFGLDEWNKTIKEAYPNNCEYLL